MINVGRGGGCHTKESAEAIFNRRTVTEAERGTMSDLSYRANEGCKQKDLHTYCGNGYVPPGLAEKGWRIDKSLSTNEQEIWINDKTKETVIANRGTAKLGEIAGPDRCIAMNQYNEKCTGHASRALEVARKVEASYRNMRMVAQAIV